MPSRARLFRPFASCVMLTGDREEFMHQAVRCFERQTYANRELIVIDDGVTLPAVVPEGPNVRYFRLPPGLTPSERLHYGFQQARGQVYVNWDDLAWHAPTRLSRQVAPLNSNDASVMDSAPALHLETGRHYLLTKTVAARSLAIRADRWPVPEGRPARAFEVVNNGLWFLAVRQGRPGVAIAGPKLPARDRAFYDRFSRAARRDGPGMPMASCIMPTSGRRQFVPDAIQRFLEQDYPHLELIIVDDGDDPVEDLVPRYPSIRYYRLAGKRSVGAKRNIACEHAQGEIILHWDDDDWHATWRVSHQVEHMRRTRADICGLDQVYFLGPGGADAWLYTYPANERPWVCGGTLCYLKSHWEKNRFPDHSVGEDNAFVWSAVPKVIHPLTDRSFYVATIHERNTSVKSTWDSRWTPLHVDEIRALLGEDWNAVTGRTRPAGPPPPKPEPSALLTLGAGIGDILRATPLIAVLNGLGYATDVAVETDYAEVVTLLESAPGIRTLFHRASPWAGHRGASSARTGGLADRTYDLAVHAPWTAPAQFPARARRTLHVPSDAWLQRGIGYALERLAGEAGWRAPLPKPVAVTSGRSFDLPPGTVGMHPGCKPGWPWKKWHGFAALSERFPSVAIAGTVEDLENSGTYFNEEFSWPAHVRNYAGALSLADTAALISQCAAFVSNDSGLMHLAAALGVPTYGIFGITSPQREALPLENFHPVSKRLPCEPECRQLPARRDCDLHLQCLKTLDASEVYERILADLPWLTGGGSQLTPPADAGYFAANGGGGWPEGYHWHILGPSYQKLGDILTGALPSAATFLDAGCAKGFLVHALRMRGREASGFDASPAALEHCVAAARPYLRLATVEEFQTGAPADVLLLFDILDQLPVETARAFLLRARKFTRGCAVLGLDHSRKDAHRLTPLSGRDWVQEFLRAGWRRDFVHETFSAAMGRESATAGLPWELHVFAP